MANPNPNKNQQSNLDVMMDNVQKPKLPTSAQDLEPKHSDTPQADASEEGQQQSLERGEAIEGGPVRDEQHEETHVAMSDDERTESSNTMLDDLSKNAAENPHVKNQDLYGGHRQGGYGNNRVEGMETEDEGGNLESRRSSSSREVNGVDLDAPADETGFAPDPKNPNAPKRLSGNEG
jgi:hypothetical protein